MNKINHIFIFCDKHDEVAQEFIDFGFVEGSSRLHENQGTRNRFREIVKEKPSMEEVERLMVEFK